MIHTMIEHHLHAGFVLLVKELTKLLHQTVVVQLFVVHERVFHGPIPKLK